MLTNAHIIVKKTTHDYADDNDGDGNEDNDGEDNDDEHRDNAEENGQTLKSSEVLINNRHHDTGPDKRSSNNTNHNKHSQRYDDYIPNSLALFRVNVFTSGETA